MAYHPGKSFRLPAWRHKQIDATHKANDRLVNVTVARMATVIERAVSEIFYHFEATGRYVEPTLNGMSSVTEHFYRDVLTSAWRFIKDTKNIILEKKELAKGPIMPPKNAQSLEDIFSNSRYWRSVMKRSEMMTKRMKTHYLRKLKEKFNEIVPLIRSGEATPQEVKDQMIDAWSTSRSRVETIFRTETTNYFAKSQVSFFQDDSEIIGFLFDSVRDTARTDICKSRHGLVYKPGTKLLRENTPALHYNCRSHLIPLANTPANRKMVDDEARNPENRDVAPIPNEWKK